MRISVDHTGNEGSGQREYDPHRGATAETLGRNHQIILGPSRNEIQRRDCVIGNWQVEIRFTQWPYLWVFSRGFNEERVGTKRPGS